MSLPRRVRRLVVALGPWVLLAVGAGGAWAQSCGPAGCGAPAGVCTIPGQGGCCDKFCCPPPLVHCTPKPPKLKFKCACPKPVCDPCTLDGNNYGYYPTCWRPWTAEPNYDHCPVPTPTQLLPPGGPEAAPPQPMLPAAPSFDSVAAPPQRLPPVPPLPPLPLHTPVSAPAPAEDLLPSPQQVETSGLRLPGN